MIENIIKEMAGFYNKKVIFNTSFDFCFDSNTENIKSFKLKEEVIGEDRYITTVRIEEFEHHISVVKFEIITVNNNLFLENKVIDDKINQETDICGGFKHCEDRTYSKDFNDCDECKKDSETALKDAEKEIKGD